MEITLIRTRRLATACALTVAVFVTAPASAQSQLDTSEARAFIGRWDLAFETQIGPFNLDLDIEDEGGKITARMGSPDLGGSREITDITQSGDSLLMRYQMDAQGQMVSMSMTLSVAGEGLSAQLDFAEGMFSAIGTATRADG